MTDDVSVVIPCYNAARWLPDTLRSALMQVCANKILVIDDGSTDNTSELLARDFHEIRSIRTDNQGVSSARNLGIQETSGAFLLFLDADDLLVSGSVERHIKAAADGADVVYGDWARMRLMSDGHWRVTETVVRSLTGPPDLDYFRGFWCPTAAYLYRRKIVEKVGGFNPRLPVIQDARFAHDCALHGGTFVYSAGVACHYRMHDSGSVSTASKSRFLKDILTNTIEIRDLLKDRGKFTDEYRRAVLACIDQVAVGTAGRETELFRAAVQTAYNTTDNPVSHAGRITSLFTRLFGYKTGHTLAAILRRLAF